MVAGKQKCGSNEKVNDKLPMVRIYEAAKKIKLNLLRTFIIFHSITKY